MNKIKNFQRKIEDFVCEKCGEKVEGNGYTDHCPVCLWSKHVDINPGDRLADCGGMMKPAGFEVKNGKYIIYYKCVKCGFEHKVKLAPLDNFSSLIELS